MRYLVIALLLFVTVPALAEFVDPNAPNGQASIYITDGSMYVLCTDGLVYRLGWNSSDWVLMENQLPVPVSEMLSWTPNFIITYSSDLWRGDLGYNKQYLVDCAPTEL